MEERLFVFKLHRGLLERRRPRIVKQHLMLPHPNNIPLAKLPLATPLIIDEHAVGAVEIYQCDAVLPLKIGIGL